MYHIYQHTMQIAKEKKTHKIYILTENIHHNEHIISFIHLFQVILYIHASSESIVLMKNLAQGVIYDPGIYHFAFNLIMN